MYVPLDDAWRFPGSLGDELRWARLGDLHRGERWPIVGDTGSMVWAGKTRRMAIDSAGMSRGDQEIRVDAWNAPKVVLG